MGRSHNPGLEKLLQVLVGRCAEARDEIEPAHTVLQAVNSVRPALTTDFAGPLSVGVP